MESQPDVRIRHRIKNMNYIKFGYFKCLQEVGLAYYLEFIMLLNQL